jgi:hypothetical protein
MVASASPARLLVRLAQAGLKRTAAAFRSAGMASTAPDWPARAEVCARCTLVVVKCGKSYCGRPFLNQIERDEPTEGCGCPVLPKAKDPAEHCPRDLHYNKPTVNESGHCNCMWCVDRRRRVSAPTTDPSNPN